MKRLFVPLWSPPEESYAGGFYRARRIVESLKNFEPFVAANDTYHVSAKHIVRYRARDLQSDHPILFFVFRILNWLWSTTALTAIGLLWRIRFDAVYAGPSEIPPISLSGLIVAKMRRIPLIVCNQNVYDTQLWQLNRKVHNSATAVITVSHALASELRGEGVHIPIFVGTNGVDDLSIARQTAQYDGIFVGRHTEAKGIFDLLHGWKIICRSRPGSQLISVGPITPRMKETMLRMLAALDLRNNVTFRGPVPEGEKWQLYALSRVCVFPSHVEGWGIVPIEAHLAGLPVVAYNLAAYADTIAVSPGAKLVPTGSVHDLARATLAELEQPSADPAVLQQWAKRFTWANAVREEERIIARVL